MKATLVIFAVAIISVIFFFFGEHTSQAQAESSQWSAPTLLYSSNDQIVDPNVVADLHGGVHVLWHLNRSPKRAGESRQDLLFYAQFVDGHWSNPTDVIASSSAVTPMAAIDQFGVIHLYWSDSAGNLLTSNAPIARASLAAAWSSTTQIQNSNRDGDIVTDAAGTLFLVYPSVGASGLFLSKSNDGGQTWSFPVTIAGTDGPDADAEFTRVAVGPDGVIHVVWTEFQLPNGWPPLGVYYARSADGGMTWSAPIQIAGNGFTQASVAAGPNGAVHIAWNGMSGIQGRYHRWSTDGGKTWSNAGALGTPGLGGSDGPPQLAVDSSGTVHLVTTDAGRVWYTFWRDGHWSAPEYVPSGRETGLLPSDKPVPFDTRQIEQVVMTLGKGNQLHVVFWDNRRAEGQTYVWYTTKVIGVPATLPLPFSTRVPGAVAEATPTSAVSVSAPVSPMVSSTPITRVDSRLTILFGLLPATVVVGGLLSWFALRLRQ